jgi:hypothetical protein
MLLLTSCLAPRHASLSWLPCGAPALLTFLCPPLSARMPHQCPRRRTWLKGQLCSPVAAAKGVLDRFEKPLSCSYAAITTDAGDSLPHPAALHPALPGPDRFRPPTDEELAAQARNDYTVLPLDLHR